MRTPSQFYTILSLIPLLAIALTGCSQPPGPIELIPQSIGSEALFIGASAVSEDVAWLSGTAGTFAFTTDGGATWTTGQVPGADTLQFRDVHAFDANTAFLLSAGTGTASRIYKTSNSGSDWELQWTNPEPSGFFDCLDFWDRDAGLLYGDSIDGRHMVFRTDDSGATWVQVDPAALPNALPGEGGFAASGTCLRTHGDSTAWIGSGAGTRPRILKTLDRGNSWIAHEIDLPAGEQAGVFSISFQDALNGIAVGGDLQLPDEHSSNVATTNDGGRTWQIAGQPVTKGVLYGSSYVPGAPTPTIFVTGPSGVDYSEDNGMTWTNLDTLNYWTTSFAGPSVGWIAGTGGNVKKVVIPR